MMNNVKTAYDASFMRGVEHAVPKIAEMLMSRYGLSLEDGEKVASAWLTSAFEEGLETKTAFQGPGGGFGSTFGMQNELPSQRMRFSRRRGIRQEPAPGQNNYAGSPPPTSIASTATGVAGGGAIGYGMLQNARAQGASNAIRNNFANQVGASKGLDRVAGGGRMTAAGRQAEIAKRTNAVMPRWLQAQNRRMSGIVANVAQSGLDPAAAQKEIQKQFMSKAGKGAMSADNLKNFLKHNALKGSAARWGLGGLGLLGISQLL